MALHGLSVSGLNFIHTNTLGTATNWTTPKQAPVLAGTFTPSKAQILLSLDTSHDIAEPLGSWVTWHLYWGPTGTTLTPKHQGDALATGVTHTLLGSTGGRQAGGSRQVLLSGLTPGTTYAYEVSVGLVGGAGSIQLGNSPNYVACSETPSPWPDGALIVAVKDGATPPNLKLYKSQHTNGRLLETLTNTFAQPAAATTFGKLDVTPDGSRVVICNQVDNAVQIYTTGLLTGAAAALQVRVPFSAPTTTPIDVVCMPDNLTAWVIGGGQYAMKLDLVAGTFSGLVTLGASTGVQTVQCSPDGAFIYIACQTAGNIRKIQTSNSTVVATSASFPGVKAVGVSPDGTQVFGATTGQNPNKVIKLNASDLSTVTSVNISGTTHNAEAIEVFADGRGFLVASSIGAAGSGIKQYDTSDLSNYTNWGVHGSTSTTNSVVNDVAITPTGTIFVPAQTDGGLAIWFGGNITFAANDNFWDHRIEVRVAEVGP